MPKTNQDLLLDILKSLSSLHRKNDFIIENMDIIKKQILDLNYRMPERKSGWIRDYWDTSKK